MDWYNNIESGIREVVKLLRDNGFNTTCSCHHDMSIEGDLVIDRELKRLHDLLYNYYHEKQLIPNYEIHFMVKIQDGYIIQHGFYIKLNSI